MKITKTKIICNTKDDVRLVITKKNICKNRTIIINFSDASYLFFDMTIPTWVTLDTTKVNNMAYAFYKSIIKCSLYNLDVSNVVNMQSTFSFSIFNKPISKWITTKVKNINFMFHQSNFNKNISNLDFSNVETKDNVFLYCPIKEIFKPKFN